MFPQHVFMENIRKLVFNYHQMSHAMRKPVYAICEQQRRRLACASPQSVQHFVVHCLDSVIPVLVIVEISSAEQAGLSLNWLQMPKTGFLMTWLNYLLLFL